MLEPHVVDEITPGEDDRLFYPGQPRVSAGDKALVTLVLALLALVVFRAWTLFGS